MRDATGPIMNYNDSTINITASNMIAESWDFAGTDGMCSVASNLTKCNYGSHNSFQVDIFVVQFNRQITPLRTFLAYSSIMSFFVLQIDYGANVDFWSNYLCWMFCSNSFFRLF